MKYTGYQVSFKVSLISKNNSLEYQELSSSYEKNIEIVEKNNDVSF